MAGRINGVHHIAISVPDLDKAREFYVGLLGFEEGPAGSWAPGTAMNDRIMRLKDSSGRALFVRAGNIFIEFFEFATPKPAPLEPDRPVNNYGYTHMALDVTDLASIHARLVASGVDFHTTPITGYGVRRSITRIM